MGRLPTCARVSHAWHQACIPILWSSSVFNTFTPVESLYVHRYHVKELRISNTLPTESIAWRFPNLNSLDTGFADNNLGIQEFILGHPTVSRLELWPSFYEAPGSEFWKGLLGFNNLNDLTLSLTHIKEEDIDTIWQLCARVERLSIGLDGESRNWNRPSMKFSRIKELQLRSRDHDGSMYSEMMKRCPGLTSIVWEGEFRSQEFSQVCQLASEGTWPELESVWYEKYFMSSDDELFMLLGSMKRIVMLEFAGLRGSFGPRCREILRSRWSGLKALDLTLDDGLTSPMVQEILSTCHLLERLMVPRIDACDIVAGEPWVCTRLEVLSASFRFNPLRIHDHQPLVLDQLSRLTRLRYLHLGHQETSSRFPTTPVPAFKETFDLRLQKGLNKLSTLRALQEFSFEYTRQIMGASEIEWMNEHWINLERIYGLFDCRGLETNTALCRMFDRLVSTGTLYQDELCCGEDSIPVDDQ